MSVQNQLVSERLSETISAVPPSATLEMAAKSRELRAQGHDVITFSLGEPDQNPPPSVLQAAHEAIDAGFHRYPPVNGYLDLREAICTKFKRDNDLDYLPEQITVSTGAKQSVFNVIQSLIGPGMNVILPAPFWVSYEGQVLMAGGEPRIVASTLEQDLKAHIDDIAAAIDENTRLLIFSSPTNPSGSVVTRQELEQLREVVLKYPDLIVISDEIYEHIIFSGEHVSLASLPGMKDRVVTINGLSKAFSMTGWRIGFMGAPTWLAKACNKVQGQITSGPNTIAQRAAIAALELDGSAFKDLQDLYRSRRDLVLDLLSEIPGLRCNRPEGAFYVMPDISAFFGKEFNGRKISNGNELCMYLLQEAHVAIVDGAAFGMPGHMRMSYATSEDVLKEGIRRMKVAIQALV